MAHATPANGVIARTVYEALRRENAELRGQLQQANGLIGKLTDEIGRLSKLVAQGNERSAELLAIAKRKLRGKESDKPAKPPEAPADLDDAQRAAYEDRPKPPELPPKKKRKKKKARPTGRKPLPQHLPVDEHEVHPDECEHCHSTNLEARDVVVEEKLDLVKAHVRRRRTTRHTCLCKDCGRRATGRALPSPFPRSKATGEFIAWLVHQKFSMLLPLDRIRRDLATQGVPLAPSYLVSQIERAADLLAAIDGEHWGQLLRGNWMATDATGLKVLIPGLPGSHNGHMEVYRRDDLVVFQYEAHKGADALVAKLKRFAGLLVADAEHRHNPLFVSGRILEAGCNAHGRRKWRDAEKVQPTLAKEAGAFISAMYVAEAEAQKKGLTGDALREWRQAKVPRIRDELLRWMDAVEPTLLPGDILAKVIRYYRNHWDALFRFVDHPEIPIDNSASEREFQNFAKLRLNSLFAGSTEGAHRTAVLFGITSTCRNLGINAEEYLSWVFTRVGTHRDLYNLSAAQLTPAAYKRVRDG